MQITLLALLTLFTTTGLASRALDPRAVAKTHLYVCTEKAWAGRCKNVEVTVGKCVNMGKAFDKNVSSAGPDDGTFCTLYSDKGCRGKAIPFTNPGIADFDKYKFENELSSVRCDFIWGWPKKSG